MATYIDLTNKKIGKLTVLERDYTTSKTGTYWKCQCECGKIISCRRDTLTQHNKTSCGCDLFKKNSKAHLKDETGNTYGRLTVLGPAEKRENNTHLFWRCKCSCGKEIVVNGQYLRSGTKLSCGCDNMSHGEEVIASLLDANNINYKTQYTFEDCVSPIGNLLRFDFAIFDENNHLLSLIEYNGRQHYEPIEYFGGQQQFKRQWYYDKIKYEYCVNNNIPLIIIPYYMNTNKLTLDKLGVIK